MKVTEKGAEVLEADWKICLQSYRDLESILRGATVALFMEDALSALQYVSQMALERDGPMSAAATPPRLSASSPIAFYGEIRVVYNDRRRAMEAAVLREFESRIKEVLQRKREG